MADEPVVVQEPVVEKTPTVVEETKETKEIKQPTRNELLRELSKEYGVNLFDVDGIAKFKEYQDSQKSEQEKLQEQIKAYEDEKANWQKEKLEYELKLKASSLGISPENMEDVMKLAEGNPDNLVKVLEKYPIFKSKEGVQIGVQQPNANTPPTENTEIEAYMAQNPRIYGGKK